MAVRLEACTGHDAFRFSVAVDLAAERGEAFAIMVMQVKGWGVIDLAQAGQWLQANGHHCRCPKCRPRDPPRRAPPPAQLSLF
ncbi:hypothetical protein [Salipiger marinus]|uniref:hypothetical protein n=1 Tax=Salipiger marinus TaxID=555512 RepID=UPI00104272C8|nr:hypothetical protein [Salipiger marinus]